jgi:predicted transcriptional regulator
MAIEGHVTREKVGKLLDYVELMGGVDGSYLTNNFVQRSLNNCFEKTLSLIFSHFSDKTFLSKDLQRTYKSVYNMDVPLSTISTYLSRLTERGVLTRSGSPFEWRYSVKSIKPADSSSLAEHLK